MNSNLTRMPLPGFAPLDLKPQRNERGEYSTHGSRRHDRTFDKIMRVHIEDEIGGKVAAPNLTGKVRRRRAPAESERPASPAYLWRFLSCPSSPPTSR